MSTVPCIGWISRGEETSGAGEAGNRSEPVENKAFLCKRKLCKTCLAPSAAGTSRERVPRCGAVP